MLTGELQSVTYLKRKNGIFFKSVFFETNDILNIHLPRMDFLSPLSLTCLSFKAAWTEGLFSICWASLLFLALASCCCCCMVARIFTGIGCLFFSMLVKLQGRIKRVFKESFITYIYWHFTVLKIGSPDPMNLTKRAVLRSRHA